MPQFHCSERHHPLRDFNVFNLISGRSIKRYHIVAGAGTTLYNVLKAIRKPYPVDKILFYWSIGVI